jgi:hypothetical protein
MQPLTASSAANLKSGLLIQNYPVGFPASLTMDLENPKIAPIS